MCKKAIALSAVMFFLTGILMFGIDVKDTKLLYKNLFQDFFEAVMQIFPFSMNKLDGMP